MSASPIGTMLLVGGAMILTLGMARNSDSTWSTPTARGFISGLRPAALQISSATLALTREKSACSAPFSVRPLVSRSIEIKTPSSTPYGCGLIARGSRGSSWVSRSRWNSSPLGGL